MDWIQTVLWALLLLVVWLWIGGSRPKGLPPGPKGLPLLGYYPFLGKVPFVTLTNLSRQYGKVFTLPMFGRHAIVLNDWTSIKEALIRQADVFTGRPPTIISEVLLDNADVAFTTEMIGWRERRRFTLHQLRDFGFGRKTMEGIVQEEIGQLLKHWQHLDGQKVIVDNLFFFSMMNIIWSLVGSKRFEYGDCSMAEFTQTLDFIFRGLTNESPINFILDLRHLPGSGFRQYQKAYEKLDAFLTKEVDDHVTSYQEGHARDFIDAYLAEVNKHKELENPVGLRSFQRKHLNAVIFDLFLGGTDTGNNTLSWALLYMITWPEIQKKVQQELDTVVGRARLPTMEDRSMLPYTEAVLMEVQRFSTIVPLSVNHYTAAQANLFGYTIPKSTVVFENVWAVHRDPELWGDPEVFRPERFLKDDGKAYKPEYLIPFSVGGRVCLGEALARMEMFLFFTALLHHFSFSKVPGEDLPSFEPLVRLTIKPKPFPLTIEHR